MFTIYSDSDAGSTLVPNLFIDEYMRDANDAQIKIYLYLLRMMSTGRATSISDMADRFNHTEREVLRSLRYWETKGLVILEYNSRRDLAGIRLTRLSERPSMEILPGETLSAPAAGLSAMAVPGHGAAHFDPLQSPQAPAAPSYDSGTRDAAEPSLYPSGSSLYASESLPAAGISFPAAETPLPAAEMSSPAAEETAVSSVPLRTVPDKTSLDAFCSSAGRAQLLFVIEQYIGKPLSPNEIQSVYYISEDLHFSDALIDYLLQYCIDRGKKDFRYIEKVAVNWAEHGITTPKQAERAVSPLRKKHGNGMRPQANPFNRFQQNQYDFDQLEKEILSN